MELRVTVQPVNGATLVEEHLQRLARRTGVMSERAGMAAAQPVQAAQPVYDLRADEVVAGKGLAGAVLTGYRYLVGAGEGAAAAAEVTVDASGAARAVTGVNYGQFVPESARVLARVSQSQHPGSFEVRILRYSAIPVMAVWLKGEAGTEDLLYVLAPAPAGMQVETPYSPEQFFTALAPISAARAGGTGPMVP